MILFKQNFKSIKVLTREDELITLKDLQDNFAEYLTAEFKDDFFGDMSCSCDGEFEKPSDYHNLQEYLDYNNDDYSIETKLNQREWGTYGRYCHSNITLELLKNGNVVSNVNIRTNRELDNKEDDSDFYKDRGTYKNIYSIYDIEFNNEKLVKEGHVVLHKLHGFSKYLTSMEINKIKIDVDSNYELEIENE